jgi:hypothetical protein
MQPNGRREPPVRAGRDRLTIAGNHRRPDLTDAAAPARQTVLPDLWLALPHGNAAKHRYPSLVRARHTMPGMMTSGPFFRAGAVFPAMPPCERVPACNRTNIAGHAANGSRAVSSTAAGGSRAVRRHETFDRPIRCSAQPRWSRCGHDAVTMRSRCGHCASVQSALTPAASAAGSAA